MIRFCKGLTFIITISIVALSFSNIASTFAQKVENIDQKNELDESIMGTALDLDGDSSYVEIKDSDVLNSLSKQLTVSVWVKTNTYPDRYSSILYKGDPRTPDITNRSFVLYLGEDGAVLFSSSPKGMSEESVVSDPGSITRNKWHHIAGVIDSESNQIRIFIDGKLSTWGGYPGVNGLYESFLPLRIGNSHEEERPTHSSFSGQIDDVSIWNIALTDKQISDYMNKQLAGKEEGLAAYWNFNNSLHRVVSDLSPNKNHGRLMGDAKVVDYIRHVTLLDDAQLDKVADIFKKRIRAGVDNLGPYQSLAEIYIRKNLHTDAEKVYLSALDVKLTQYEHDNVIEALKKLYNLRDAKAEFIKLLEELKPRMENSAILHELLGDAYMDGGEEEKAQIAYRQWLKIQTRNVDQLDVFEEYNNLADKLLDKNLFPDDALDLVLDDTEFSSTSHYMMTLGYALLLNELNDEAYQLIEANMNSMLMPFMERRWFLRIIKAGRYVKDKVGYIKVLERLADAMPPDSPNYFNSVFALAQFYKENNLSEKADELIKKTGFVSEDAWMVLAPFDNRQGFAYNTEYIYESLLKIDTKAKYDGKYGKISWKKHEDEVLNGYIALGHGEDWAAGYAYTVVVSPDNREVDFRFDSDDQGKVWLNGMLIFEHTKTFTAQIDNFEFHASLKKGRNIILVKVCEETGGWGFYLRITDKNGNPYDDLKINTAEK